MANKPRQNLLLLLFDIISSVKNKGDISYPKLRNFHSYYSPYSFIPKTSSNMDSQGPTTIHVKNISTQTSEDQVRDFFSFCGKISSISVTKDNEGTQSAAVTFEKVSPTPIASLPTPTPFTYSYRLPCFKTNRLSLPQPKLPCC